MAGIFRFKQFDVDQTGCAMKINTDGVLLGALSEVTNPISILDIGTGTGVVSLMLAQRFANANIDAVEIDETAAKTATQNFAGSPFADRLALYADSFENHLNKHPDRKYDLIISNPPFHINSLESSRAQKSLAKHTDKHFFESLIKTVALHLTENGVCWLILPIQTGGLVKQMIVMRQLHIKKTISICSYPDSIPHREILVLTLSEIMEADSQFVIYAEPNEYSDEYQSKLKDFFTIF